MSYPKIEKSRLAVATSAIVLFAGGVAPAQAETLQEAVQVMLETNPELGTYTTSRDIREQVVRQARADYYPRLDFEAGAGVQEFQEPADVDLDPRSYRLGLRQNIFTGFATKNNVERTEAHVRSSAYEIRDTANNVALRASKAYLDVLLKRGTLDLANENLANHERIQDQIELRSGSGVSRKADLDQIESRLSLAKSNVVVTRSNMIDAETSYQAVIGHAPVDLVQPPAPDDLMPATMEEAIRIAVEEHPRLISMGSEINARKAQHEIAKAPYYPVLDFELDKIWEEDIFINPTTERESWLAYLRLRWNLFDGMRDDARKKETAFQVEEAKEIRNNTYREVVESIRLSWMSYQGTLERLEFLQSRVDSANKTAEAYKKQWNIGQRTLLDVLDSEAELIQAKEQLLRAQNEKHYAQYRILDGMGRLVPAMGLKYPQQAYLEEDEETEAADKEAATGDIKEEMAGNK